MLLFELVISRVTAAAIQARHTELFLFFALFTAAESHIKFILRKLFTVESLIYEHP